MRKYLEIIGISLIAVYAVNHFTKNILVKHDATSGAPV